MTNNDNGMEKYAVDTTPDGEKHASPLPEKCPECGREAIRHGAVTLCPVHGSRPFER